MSLPLASSLPVQKKAKKPPKTKLWLDFTLQPDTEVMRSLERFLGAKIARPAACFAKDLVSE